MNDFIFGTLATEALRLEHARAQLAGVTHAHALTPRDPLPGQALSVELSAGPDHPCESAWVYWTRDGGDPRQGQRLPMQPAGVEWNTLLWGYLRRYRAELPGQAAGTVLRYMLSIRAGEDETFADQGRINACYIADDPTPAWTERAVVYQIFVDRFYPGMGRSWAKPKSLSGFFGGTLNGITEKLGYLADLGVNTLWLTPVFPSPTHHGYDATDLFDIEPRLGTPADLRRLCEQAHGRGMRLLLDFVPNHWSDLHPTFQEALRQPRSPYRQWYTFAEDGQYESFFGVQSMPQLNLSHPATRRHLLDSVRHWLEAGVDGYRLDYAVGPVHDFWADFRREVFEANPQAWTFGEVVEPSDSQLRFEGQLHGCLDFMLLEAFRQTFGWGLWDARRFADFLQRHEAYFPPGFSRPSFLDNHDMNRFLWITGGDQRRLKLAALCQFALSGQPVIYYGTEVGLTQVRDVRQDSFGIMEEARLPMPWDERQDLELFAFYQRLIRLRLEHPSLRGGSRRILHVDAGTLAFTSDSDAPGAAAVFNLSAEPRLLNLPGDWHDLLLATSPECDLYLTAGLARVSLPPLGGVYIK